MAAPVFTVHDAMIQCGVNNVAMFGGLTAAQRLASDAFGDEFTTCMDKTFEELEGDFKSYSTLTSAQGQIRLLPGVQRNIKAFIQWTRDEIRLGHNPAGIAFPVDQAVNLIRRYKSHKTFVDKAKTISDAAKPEQFTGSIKWADWYPTFENYLRAIPGRNGTPLAYIIRVNDAPDPTPHPNFLDDYISMAPLAGEAFTIDAAEVHTYVVKFTAGNETAEAKIQAFNGENNGRVDVRALVDHYEGVGMHAIDIIKAEKTLKDLFYAGEKKPHMWWEEFEKQLSMAFTIIERREQRMVYSDQQKLRILSGKITADFLGHIKAAIDIEMTWNPVTMTYVQALANFRNAVNSKFPPEMAEKQRHRRVQETNTGRGRGRGGGRGRGRGRGGRGGRGRGGGSGNVKRQHPDARTITGNDGNSLQVHPSYGFSSDEWRNIPRNEQDRLRQQRQEYNASKKHKADGSTINQVTVNLPAGINEDDARSRISAITSALSTTGGNTIMGGRVERENERRGAL
jgi:uncharacterized membrane protein YgcG